MTEVVNRMKEPTPRFFIRLRNAGLLMAGISAAVLTAPVMLPAIVIKIAGYLAVAGSVAGTVSQTAVKYERE